jgi:hypothetical protein
MTYRGAGSPDKRDFNQLYDHLLKPMISKQKHLEMKPLQDEALLKEVRKWHDDAKSVRKEFYTKVRKHYKKELSKLQEGETFRKKAEVLEPSFIPQINTNTANILKRARSVGYNSDDGLVSSRISSSRMTRRV